MFVKDHKTGIEAVFILLTHGFAVCLLFLLFGDFYFILFIFISTTSIIVMPCFKVPQ